MVELGKLDATLCSSPGAAIADQKDEIRVRVENTVAMVFILKIK